MSQGTSQKEMLEALLKTAPAILKGELQRRLDAIATAEKSRSVRFQLAADQV